MRLRKISKTTAALLIALTVLSTAFGAILLQKQVGLQMRIRKTFAMDVYDVDKITPLTFINLGDFHWEEDFYYPGKTESAPTQTYFVNNTDQTDFYLQWDYEAPANVYLALYVKRMDQATFDSLPKGAIFQLPLTSRSLDPDHPLWHDVQFYFMVYAANGAPFGDWTPTITFTAVDSPIG